MAGHRALPSRANRDAHAIVSRTDRTRFDEFTTRNAEFQIMNVSLLDILRCPYCGGRLELVTSMFHRTEGETIRDGILGCHCCIFAVVDGIPVLHLQPSSTD